MANGFRARGTRLRDPRHRAGWRRLGVFWLTVLLLMAAGGGAVQYLGPPRPAMSTDTMHAPVAAEAFTPKVTVAGKAPETAVATAETGDHPAALAPTTPGKIAEPDAGLLEPAGVGMTEQLPRIGPNGRTPMKAYAAAFDTSSRLPRVGVMLAGIGLNDAESEAAIHGLPGAVSLAISPYSPHPSALLADARASGHEYLIAIPLEPVGFPLNDPGPATLLTSAPEAVNVANLHWALSRIDGYVGATGVIGTMRGERLAAMTDQMDAVLSDLAGRGLLYIDPRAGRGPVAKAWGRHIDSVIDESPDRDSIDAKLADLEQEAKDHGSALGLVMQPTPVAVARVAAWANGLAARGLVLAPASALVLAPPDVPVKMSDRDH